MMTILKSKTTKAHIDYQLKKPHWIALIVLAVAIAFASIHPLELSSYILHQVGTVFMLVTLIICLYKNGAQLNQFYALYWIFADSYTRCALSIFLCTL